MSKPVHIVNPGSGANIQMISKNVTTAGTAVPIVAIGTACEGEVIIQAQQSNTGRIYVGGAAITNDDTTGVCLFPGDAITWDVDNLNFIYINSTVNGEGVTITYWQ